MTVTIFGEFMLLFQMACVVFLFAYLFSKSRFYTRILEHRASLALQLVLALVFGLLSLYGMSSNITFYTAIVNIRDLGPIIGGLACGPVVGLGAGMIGFMYRLWLGGTNVSAVALGPLIAGFVGGLAWYYSNRQLISTKKAVFITLIVETLISGLSILVRIVAGDSPGDMMTIFIHVALPMIVMTTFSVGIFCIILHNEILERKMQKENVLLELEVESRKNLNTIVNTIAYPVYVLDRNHHFILVNDSQCRFLGHPREEILGKTHRDFYTGDTADRQWEMAESAFRTHKSREEEVTISKPDGQECTIISTSTIYSDALGQEFMVGIIHDISEIRKMQVALSESEAWYRTLFEHTGAATIIIDENGLIEQANTEFEELTGYQRSGIEQNMVFTDIACPDDVDLVKKYIAERRDDSSAVPSHYTVRIRNRTGAIRTLHAVVAMIPRTKKTIASYIDVTEQKKFEEALKLANRKLNLLSSITRHDIINQVMVLKGYLSILKKKIADPDLLNYINSCYKSTDTIEHQITFTRVYQDMGVHAPAWQNVNDCLVRARGALGMGTVTAVMDRSDIEVLADPLFEKIFYNLIDNSLKYGGENLHAIRIRASETDHGLLITYEDDGAGISARDKEFLFERGFGKHTGFGLFLSREILSITGITIAETGTFGRGARFEMIIPKGAYRFTTV
ncbi:MAG: PAS domain S-box protein [Methanoregula sp.]